jgi:lipoic acid synthetase
MKLPHWLIKRTPKSENIRKIRSLIGDKTHTVCEEAKCPNIGECYQSKTVTFMILGDTCTRSCKFCGVTKGPPPPVDDNEPKDLAEAAKKLGLEYVVVTSVTRDDLPDGGATQFAKTVHELRTPSSALRIELLIPDFAGNIDSLKIVTDSRPDVLNHNIEMVPRLYKDIRPSSNYRRSLDVLINAKKLSPELKTKSGFMMGLGETEEEVKELIEELHNVRCDILIIGQYIPPTQNSFPVVEYLQPEKFEKYRDYALKTGIKTVFSGPFVRSS